MKRAVATIVIAIAVANGPANAGHHAGGPAEAGRHAPQTPQPPPRPLSIAVPIHDTLAGGGRVVYTLDIPANEAAHVTIAQEGIDVRWILRPADATVPNWSVDYVGGPSGVEDVYAPIGDAPASWQLIVLPAIASAARGEYTVTLDMAPADDHAKAIAAARALHVLALDPGPETNNTTTGLAQQRYIAAADAARRAGDPAQEAESTFQAARTYDVLGDQLTALEWQRRALELFRRVGGRQDREARVLNRLGDVSRKVGAVTDAEQYLREALPLARAARDAYNIVDVLNNTGLLLSVVGRYDEAIDVLQAAIAPAQEAGAGTVEGTLNGNLGHAFFQLGQPEKAVEFLDRSIEIKKRQGIPRQIAVTQLTLAEVLFSLGDRAKADATLASAIELFEKAGDRAGAIDARGTSALFAHAAGDTDRALGLFAEVEPKLRELQMRFSHSSLLTAWADVELDRGAAASALPKADEAARLARAIANPQLTQKALYAKARALQQQDRVDEAIAAIVEAIEGVETMRGALRRPDVRTSYLAAVRQYFDLYIDLLYRRGAAAQAFEVSERARARTLLEGLAASASKISKGVDPALLARRRAIEADLNAKENYRAQVVLASGANSPKAAAVGRDLARLLDEWNDVRGRIRAASPAFSALETPEPVAAGRVQSSLVDAGSALVSYYVGAARSYAWVVDRQSITVHELPAAAKIDAVARRYHELLSRDVDALPAAEQEKTAKQIAAAGSQLAAIVWKPLAARLNGKRLLIVGDGVLQYVPFAALPGAGGQPLIVDHEIAYLPSASVLETIRQRSRPISPTAATAVFADPVFSKNDPRLAAARDSASPSRSRAGDGGTYGRLRFSRAEADAIRAVAPGSFEALDFSAAKQTLTSQNLRKYRILHFATHGSLNTEHPELSGLVFSLVDKAGKPVDGFLRLHEIYNLDLDADLVVLSACRTALGKEVHGEGLIGLTRGFMYAGATRVVSSVWNVDDRASARLMTRFYEAMLTKKMSPASALREAQLSLLREPRWANPHYWAAFGLQGEWR